MEATTKEEIMGTGAYYFKRGDTFDIEDFRMTHRLRVARSILASQGIEPTWEHSDSTMCEFGRVKHCCDYRCKASWDEWVTDEIFELAFDLADEIQDRRGSYHRNAAYAAKAAQVA